MLKQFNHELEQTIILITHDEKIANASRPHCNNRGWKNYFRSEAEVDKMWKDYSSGYVKKNRASSISIMVAAFIATLFFIIVHAI